MKKQNRGDSTRTRILKAGIRMWKKDPASVNAHAISKYIGMTHGTVMYHFPYGVRDAVAEYALEIKDPVIIAQLIATGSALVKNMAPSERTEYMKLAAL